jgi:transposase-like protein
MNWQSATNEQLLFIAMKERCPIELKYRAVRELQERQISDDIKGEIIYEAGKGTSLYDIAQDYGLEEKQVFFFLRGFRQKHKSGGIGA